MAASAEATGLPRVVESASSSSWPAKGTIRVGPLTTILERQWDSFVAQQEHGTPFHLLAWRNSIHETYGYEAMYRVATDENGVCGVLPLFFVRNPVIGRVLISSPFAVYGGAVAGSEQARDALRDDLTALAHKLDVQHVELRNGHAGQCLGFQQAPRYVTFTQAVGEDEAAILQAIPRKTRYMVRKAVKEGLVCRRYSELTKGFLDLYLANLRRLGTPAFSTKHFEQLFRHFGEAVDVREYSLEGRLASTVLTFYFRNTVYPYYGASDESMNAHSPNNFMYFDLMRWAGKNGYTLFDFGRSKKNVGGSYDFKAHWGMMEQELPYEMLLLKRKEVPNFSPANSKFSLMMKAWSRLPLPVTRWLGPHLVRLFP